MSNSIRTPRIGTTATSRRIAQAVDNEEWQRFRLSMKGRTTKQKLIMLKLYYLSELHNDNHNADDCDVCIRLGNYLKALARGGQLFGGVNLCAALAADWDLQIKKD